MKLKDVELIPAVIVCVDDPKKMGRVQVNAPTYFKGTENLPWIYPFMTTGNGGFIMPVEGQKVWLMVDKTNYMGLRYIPFYDINEETLELISKQNNCDVLLAKNEGLLVQMYYSDSDGMIFKVGDNKVQICTDGHINIEGANGDRVVQVGGDGIFLGDNEESFEEAVLGEKLQTLLSKLKTNFENLAAISAQSAYTIHLSQPFLSTAESLGNDISKIVSKNVKLN